jgi:hypothetical protein
MANPLMPRPTEVWKNNKTGDWYTVIKYMTCADNAPNRNGTVYVNYMSEHGEFCREIKEFAEKFSLVYPPRSKENEQPT